TQLERQASGGPKHQGSFAQPVQRLGGRGGGAGPSPTRCAGIGDGQQRGEACAFGVRADCRRPARASGGGTARSRDGSVATDNSMKTYRLARVAEAVREVASETILYELRDPRVKLVTVTRAEVSGDLQHAKVYVSIMGTEKEQQLSLRGL